MIASVFQENFSLFRLQLAAVFIKHFANGFSADESKAEKLREEKNRTPGSDFFCCNRIWEWMNGSFSFLLPDPQSKLCEKECCLSENEKLWSHTQICFSEKKFQLRGIRRRNKSEEKEKSLRYSYLDLWRTFSFWCDVDAREEDILYRFFTLYFLH